MRVALLASEAVLQPAPRVSPDLAQGATLVVSAEGSDGGHEAAENAIHVLAQAPAHTRVRLPETLKGDVGLSRLARAYGVERDVVVGSMPDVADAMQIDVRPEDTPGEILALLGASGASPVAEPDTLLAGRRVAVVTNLPVHYRVALFDELAARLAADRAALRVFFLSRSAADRPWAVRDEPGFDHVFVDAVDLQRGRGRRLAPRRLRPALDDFSPTIVLSGGFSPLVSGRVARWASGRAAFGLWSGEIASRPTARSRVRRRQRLSLVRKADFAVAYGWQSARYLRGLDQRLPVVVGRNSTPGGRPGSGSRGSRLEILAVARAEPEKALDLIVDAVVGMGDVDCRLTIVGDGPELPALVARAGGSDRIRFLGALAPPRVAELYASADVFLFPSQYDVFGLVLVEAMAAGLAVVTSDKPGAVADLIAPNKSALVVSERSSAAWERAVRTLAADRAMAKTLGERARRTVESRWTIEHAAEAMIAGFRLGVLCTREAAR